MNVSSVSVVSSFSEAALRCRVVLNGLHNLLKVGDRSSQAKFSPCTISLTENLGHVRCTFHVRANGNMILPGASRRLRLLRDVCINRSVQCKPTAGLCEIDGRGLGGDVDGCQLIPD